MLSSDRIGRYPLVRLLSTGAAAEVWLGVDELLGGHVAIRVLAAGLAGVPGARERFLEQARVLRAAGSDRVVRVHDVGELPGGRPYLVMAHADGGTLADRLPAAPLPVAEALWLAVEAARGVAVLHAKGIAHGDLKPSSFLLTGADGGPQRVLLGDLGTPEPVVPAGPTGTTAGAAVTAGTSTTDNGPTGVAELPEVAESGRQGAAGQTDVPGSTVRIHPAPERAQAGAEPDLRTDVYDLGALTYYLITGQRYEPGAELPGELAPALRRALHDNRDRRWPDAESFADAISHISPAGNRNHPDVTRLPGDLDPAGNRPSVPGTTGASGRPDPSPAGNGNHPDVPGTGGCPGATGDLGPSGNVNHHGVAGMIDITGPNGHPGAAAGIDPAGHAGHSTSDRTEPRHRAVTRRRWGVLIAAAVVILSLVAGVLVWTMSGDDVATPAATPIETEPGDLDLLFTIEPPDGLRVDGTEIWEFRQAAALRDAAGDTVAIIRVHPPNGFTPDSRAPGDLPGSERLTVAGREGFYHPALPDPDTGDTPADQSRTPAVAASYREGAWYVVQSRKEAASSRDTLTRIAASVRFDARRTLKFPARFGYLPPTLTVCAGADGLDLINRWSAYIGLCDVETGKSYLGHWRPAILLSMSRDPASMPLRRDKRINGFLVDYMFGDGPHVDCGQFALVISVADTHRERYANEAERIIEGLSVRGFDDKAGWYAGAEAVPTIP